MGNKRLAINMIANLFAFIVSMGINFILSPYIINNIGKEAYGFVGLANNFVSYGQLVTLALNSMAGRFITIKIHQEDYIAANKYFTSTLLVNIFTSILLFIPSVILVVFLDKFIHVPVEILLEVQILWGLVFLNFLIGLILTTYNLATYITNRLDLSSIRDIQSNIIRVVLLISCFSLFTPRVWYIGLVATICTIFIGLSNVYFKNKLLPHIKVKLIYFDFKIIKELFLSGIWHVVIKLGQILSDGLDLLISNIFIGPLAMGTLAIAKTIPNAIFSLLSTVSNVFSPQITIHYAKQDKVALTNELIKSMKFTGFFANISFSFLLVFGNLFYKIWIPNENFKFIQILSIITVIGIFIQGTVGPLFGVFTVTNKVKTHSFVIIFIGILNALIVITLLKITNLGILVIAGVSSITAIIRDLFYTPIYSAHCLNISKKTFYKPILRYILSTFCIILEFVFIIQTIYIPTWIGLFMYGMLGGVSGLAINYFIILDRKERKFIQLSVYSFLNKFIKNQKIQEK